MQYFEFLAVLDRRRAHLPYLWSMVHELLLKTSNSILQLLSFDWLTGNGIRAHIPLTTNIVADTRQRKQLKSSNIAILLGVFNKTIIPVALVGHEIVIANSAPCASTIPYPTRARGIIVKYTMACKPIKTQEFQYIMVAIIQYYIPPQVLQQPVSMSLAPHPPPQQLLSFHVPVQRPKRHQKHLQQRRQTLRRFYPFTLPAFKDPCLLQLLVQRVL